MVASIFLCIMIPVVSALKQPHIIFVLTDDYGYNDISYHAVKNGNDTNIIATPTLDRLAESGVKLEKYYVQPVCSPTRATLLTGRYPTHTGIHVPLVDSAPGGLPTNEILMSALLKDAGYRTHMVVSNRPNTHNTHNTPTHPPTDTHTHTHTYPTGQMASWLHDVGTHSARKRV